MALRPDKPDLYYYDDARFFGRSPGANVLNLLGNIQVLLWVLITIGILILVRLWK